MERFRLTVSVWNSGQDPVVLAQGLDIEKAQAIISKSLDDPAEGAVGYSFGRIYGEPPILDDNNEVVELLYEAFNDHLGRHIIGGTCVKDLTATKASMLRKHSSLKRGYIVTLRLLVDSDASPEQFGKTLEDSVDLRDMGLDSLISDTFGTSIRDLHVEPAEERIYKPDTYEPGSFVWDEQEL